MSIWCIDPKLIFPVLETEMCSIPQYNCNGNELIFEEPGKMCRKCKKTKGKDQFISAKDNKETTTCLRCRSIDIRYKHKLDRKKKKIDDPNISICCKCGKTKSINQFQIRESGVSPLETQSSRREVSETQSSRREVSVVCKDCRVRNMNYKITKKNKMTKLLESMTSTPITEFPLTISPFALSNETPQKRLCNRCLKIQNNDQFMSIDIYRKKFTSYCITCRTKMSKNK